MFFALDFFPLPLLFSLFSMLNFVDCGERGGRPWTVRLGPFLSVQYLLLLLDRYPSRSMILLDCIKIDTQKLVEY